MSFCCSKTSLQIHFKIAEGSIFLNGPRDGAIFIYDIKDVGFRHLLQPSISSVKKGMEFVQFGSPLNISSIHILNSTPVMGLIFSERSTSLLMNCVE